MTGMSAEKENEDVQVDEQEPEILSGENIVFHCVYKNDLARLTDCFENEENPYKESIMDLVNQRDKNGKSPLDICATLGRNDILKELITRGADVTLVTEKGYSSLHHAAAWGKIGILKALIEAQADLQQKNIHKERARETALRYNQTECVDFLDWAEAKVALQDIIRTTLETIADPEKVQGRLTKDDKNVTTNTCKEKTEWIENTSDATTQDFITQKISFEEVIGPILLKLSEPATERSEKK